MTRDEHLMPSIGKESEHSPQNISCHIVGEAVLREILPTNLCENFAFMFFESMDYLDLIHGQFVSYMSVMHVLSCDLFLR